MMTPKEVVTRALRRNSPERVPVYADYVPEVQEKLEAYFNTHDYYELCTKIGNDMLMIGAQGIGASYYNYYKQKEEYTCPWGCTWKYFHNENGAYTEIIKHPLEDDDDGSKLEAFKTPDPEDPAIYERLRELIEKYGEKYFITFNVTCSIFEAAWYLHGFESTLMDMVADEDYANALLDKVMEYPLKAGLKALDQPIDMIWLGDDVGMQECMLMSPELWRKYLKPRMAKLIREYKAKRPDILVAYHSCGYIEPVIEDLIEIGLDVLNPIQPLAMDPAVIKQKYGKKLSFWGAICVQKTLPHGTEQDIRKEVLLRKETIGEGGGYLMSPAHTIQADTSLENVLAFYKAARELGTY